MRQIFTDQEKAHFFKGLVYGKPGYGKTYSSRTIPNRKRLVLLSAESGLLSIRDIKIEVLTLEEWKDVDEAINLLKPGSEMHKKYIEKRGGPIETLFIDSATELAKQCCEHVLVQRVGITAARGKTLDTIFEDQLTLEDWGVIRPRMDRMFRAFRDLPYNVIFTALENSKEDKETGIEKVMPLLYPQSMGSSVPGYFDEVYRMRQAENKDNKIVRWWETVDDGKQIAKSRLDVFEKKIKPDWTQIFNAIKGGK